MYAQVCFFPVLLFPSLCPPLFSLSSPSSLSTKLNSTLSPPSASSLCSLCHFTLWRTSSTGTVCQLNRLLAVWSVQVLLFRLSCLLGFCDQLTRLTGLRAGSQQEITSRSLILSLRDLLADPWNWRRHAGSLFLQLLGNFAIPKSGRESPHNHLFIIAARKSVCELRL